jgi:hypothetical protein
MPSRRLVSDLIQSMLGGDKQEQGAGAANLITRAAPPFVLLQPGGSKVSVPDITLFLRVD